MLAVHEEGTAGFDAALARVEARGEADFARVEAPVREILAAVRAEGDEAVLRYGERFGGRRPAALVVRDVHAAGAAALARMPAADREALELAAARIRAFHEHQRDAGFAVRDEGIDLGLRVLPVGRAGVYA
ncbi:MAG TPA: histidinol dehydrogenase, partial [Polyangiaceae bacterium]